MSHTLGPSPQSAQQYIPQDLFEDLNFYQSEENLRTALEGPQHGWAQKLPQGENIRATSQVDSDEEADEDRQIKVLKQPKHIKGAKELEFLQTCSPHFSSFIKASILHQNEEAELSDLNITDSLQNAIQVAMNEGLPSLQEEAENT